MPTHSTSNAPVQAASSSLRSSGARAPQIRDDEGGPSDRDALGGREVFFSICIPQYNRTSFLLQALRAFAGQTFRDFEICISDGGSTDGRQEEVCEFLTGSGMSFQFHRSDRNLRYDENIRTAMGLARGRYCLLFGNDDMPATPATFAYFHQTLVDFDYPEVAVPNFFEQHTGHIVRRIRAGGILGHGPEAAIRHFRDFSFVSGIMLVRAPAQRFATSKWDGSEMYQTYIACRLLSAGGRMLGLDQVAVHKDIQIPGEEVDRATNRPVLRDVRVEERKLPLVQYARVAIAAILPALEPAQKEACARRVFAQVMLYTYPTWLLQYRRVQSWRFAAGVALGMRPRNSLEGVRLNVVTRIQMQLLYLVVTVAGLLLPRWIFSSVRPAVYAFAKRPRGRRKGPTRCSSDRLLV